MPNFYVPIVLVISAENAEFAASTADEIISHLVDLEPKDLLGMTNPSGLVVSPASPDWFLRDQEVFIDGDCVLTRDN